MASTPYSSSSSMKLLLFMVPLIIIAGLVSVLGPNPSNWILIQNPPLSWTSQNVVAVDFHHSLFNQSSTPPISIQPIIDQQLVRFFYFYFWCFFKVKMILSVV